MPAFCAGLADVGGPGAEREQSLQLGVLVYGFGRLCCTQGRVRGLSHQTAAALIRQETVIDLVGAPGDGPR